MNFWLQMKIARPHSCTSSCSPTRSVWRTSCRTCPNRNTLRTTKRTSTSRSVSTLFFLAGSRIVCLKSLITHQFNLPYSAKHCFNCSNRPAAAAGHRCGFECDDCAHAEHVAANVPATASRSAGGGCTSTSERCACTSERRTTFVRGSSRGPRATCTRSGSVAL